MYIYFCFMNHKLVSVDFPKKIEPKDRKYFSSCYLVLRFLSKYRQANKPPNSV